ncbi:hypothetical protein RvY_04425 [Ramazzottius varieornatus]|uniref:Uncharacterized protein n=1 Tax=Ramazzottius varieornatus TaxID=947166 RepID=A0A1D1URJ3_RAMVA|nr:hypothetical protein RvY_04425 [Ramazzottius varieornatus]
MWVASITVDNLPISHRFNFRRNIVLWVGKIHPGVQVLPAPFVQQLRSLGTEGFPLCHPETQTELTSYAKLLAYPSDSPVHCALTCNRQYNSGDKGCTSCFADGDAKVLPRAWAKTPEGERIMVQPKSTSRVYPFRLENRPARRTHEQTRKDALRFSRDKMAGAFTTVTPDEAKKYTGVNGLSELFRLEKLLFDVIRCCPHDVMHIMLGVGEHFLNQLRSKIKLKSFPYWSDFLAKYVSEFNQNDFIV